MYRQLFVSNGPNYLFCDVHVYFTALSVSRIHVSNGGLTGECKLHWKDMVVPPPTYYSIIFTDELRKTKECFNQDSVRPDSDSNCTPPEYKSRILPVYQPVQSERKMKFAAATEVTSRVPGPTATGTFSPVQLMHVAVTVTHTTATYPIPSKIIRNSTTSVTNSGA